jgi:ribulose-phosphate 3-epimerase
MPRVRILPSILAADPGRLADACRQCVTAGADGVHIDIMDGHFVPNLSFGPATVAMARREVPGFDLNVHLMISNPDERAGAFLDAGADTLHIHIEPAVDHAAVLRGIRARGRVPGIVLNPATDIERILPFVPLVGEVLFMTVNPGFGGQAFLPDVLPKMRAFRRRFPDLDIAVDGGLNRDTVPLCGENGANVFHIGSGLFRAPDLAAEIAHFRKELARFHP